MLPKEEEMKKKFFSALMAGVLATVCLTGCGPINSYIRETEAEIEAGKEEFQEKAPELGQQSQDLMNSMLEGFPTVNEDGTLSYPKVTMTDRSGNEISVSSKVEKIVSMSPSTTELLIELGLADKIVACDTYSGFSSFASELGDIPQFDMMAPDCESIVALNPDVVITTGMSYAHGDDVYAAVKAADICVADIPSAASLDDIKKDIEFIGELTGTKEQADAIIAEMDEYKSELEVVASSIDEKKTVLYVMSVPTADYPDVYTCGMGTYMDEIFDVCGLENVAGDIEYQWPALSEEDIIAENPDVIIVGDNYTPDAVDAILAIDTWKDITAVKNGEVYLIDGDSFNQPNQFVYDSAYEIITYAYPDETKELSDPFEN